MTRYRFVTPHRTGKWYPDLATAQRFAQAIGAGFLDSRTGRFVLYCGSLLEVKHDDRAGARRARPDGPRSLTPA